MITKKLSEIVSDVAVILGESIARECQSEESPFPDLEGQVRLLLEGTIFEEAQNDTEKAGYEIKRLNETLKIGYNNGGQIELPEDYLNLIEVRLSSWKRSVFRISEPDSSEHAAIASRWEGVKANASHPMVYEGISASGKRCLILHPAKEEDMMETGWYVACPRISSAEELTLPASLYHKLLLKIAALIRENC